MTDDRCLINTTKDVPPVQDTTFSNDDFWLLKLQQLAYT